MTLRVVVQDIAGRHISADATLESTETPPETVRRQPVREEVAAFLRTFQPKIAGLLVGVKETATPRKAIEYWQKQPDGTPILYKIHFGGYFRDVWTPIYVGVSITAKDTADRDAWLLKLQELAHALPSGTTVAPAGARTAEALKAVPWNTADDLNGGLEDSLAADFKRFVAVIGDLAQRQEPTASV